jgi:hypothetical protein
MKEPWVTSIRDQCASAGVPFFFKQWGGVRKAEAGRELGGKTYDELPARKPAPAPARKTALALLAEISLTFEPA